MKWMILILTLLPDMFPATTKTWAVRRESEVSILGSSNVNSFSFRTRTYEGNDTLVLYKSSQQCVFGKGVLRIPVSQFKSSTPMLMKDFRKMLNAKNYPDILLNFRTLQCLPDSRISNQPIEAEVDITLAGRTRPVKIKLITSATGGVLYLCGKERLRFSDFGLKAPANVMGFIDVKNELDVEFRLALKEVN